MGHTPTFAKTIDTPQSLNHAVERRQVADAVICIQIGSDFSARSGNQVICSKLSFAVTIRQETFELFAFCQLIPLSASHLTRHLQNSTFRILAKRIC